LLDDGITLLGSGVFFRPRESARRSSRAGSRQPGGLGDRLYWSAHGAVNVQRIERSVSISLQHAAEFGQVGLWVDAFAVRRVGEPNRRRCRVARCAVVTHLGPQPRCFHHAVARRQHRDRGVVGIQIGAGEHVATDRVDQLVQQCTGGADLVPQQRAFQLNAFAGIDHRLPIQRKMVGELGHQDVRQQPGPGDAVRDRPTWPWRLRWRHST